MIRRFLTDQLLEKLRDFPAVALLGPRQSGKTTLALEIAKNTTAESIYLDMERPSDRHKLNDPELYLSLHQDKLVIIDEVQKFPELFPILRSLIDENRRKGRANGQYLLLGSASGDLLNQSSESLAGRISYLNLTGFNLLEIGNENINSLWLRGGFPSSYLAKSNEKSFEWRETIIQTYLEREIPNLGIRMPSNTLRRLWAMLAHSQGEIFNASRLATSLGISTPTVIRYVETLSDLFMVRILYPWSNNFGKRLVKSPKIYITDSGLCHALLGIKSFETLLEHPVIGSSWEGFVIDNISSVLSNKARLWYYRTVAGAEVDLIIEFSPNKLFAVEMKRSLSPTTTRSLSISTQDLKPEKTFIVNPGQEHYPISRDVDVISLEGLLKEIQSQTN